MFHLVCDENWNISLMCAHKQMALTFNFTQYRGETMKVSPSIVASFMFIACVENGNTLKHHRDFTNSLFESLVDRYSQKMKFETVTLNLIPLSLWDEACEGRETYVNILWASYATSVQNTHDRRV